ncbi:MAG: hypothetical protein EPO32_06340 [Anaerolineae bacterium]|nr:MAG: hypothetical protein EPO32_06340 [Anaerolineae bacterium]
MSQHYEIGRMLRGSTTEFVVGCKVTQLEAPEFGALVRAPLGNGLQAYGLIANISIEDDGLVKQLVTAENVEESVIADNRLNRNVPIEMTVLVVGHRNNSIHHLLPPRPPLSLDVIELCTADEIAEFTAAGRFGYFRHILRAENVPVGELLAAHLKAAHTAHGDDGWAQRAAQELITLLRDDYATLTAVMGALSDAVPEITAG